MTIQAAASTTETVPANAAESAPAAAWSRRVRRIGGFIQTAFAALWLARAGLAISGRAGDAVVAASAIAVTILSMTEVGATVLLSPQRPQMLVPYLMSRWAFPLALPTPGKMLLAAVLALMGMAGFWIITVPRTSWSE